MFCDGCTAGERALVATASAFARDAVAPVIEETEAARRVPDRLLREAAGLFGGLLVPRMLGGKAASIRATAAVLAAIARADLAFAFSLVVQMNLAGAIATRGTSQQRAAFLDAMMTGRIIGSFCLTEPTAGTDAAALRTVARQHDDGGWQLDGEKAWITNGTVADLFCIYSRTLRAGGDGGIAAFLLPRDTRGLGIEPPYPLMGGNAMGTTGLVMRACDVAPEQLFIAPGEGFRAAMQGIDLARVLLGAMCCAILDDGLAIASRYAGRRTAFGASTMQFQAVAFPLADVATDLRAATLLTEAAIALLDRGEDARLAAAHAKKLATTVAFSGLARCMQAMGANGFRREHALPRHLTNAKMAQYLDGTTEVQNLIIGRSIAAGAADGQDSGA